jgi:hypothetical protein
VTAKPFGEALLGRLTPAFVQSLLPEDVGLRFEGRVDFEDSEHRQYSNPAVLDMHMFFDVRRRTD